MGSRHWQVQTKVPHFKPWMLKQLQADFNLLVTKLDANRSPPTIAFAGMEGFGLTLGGALVTPSSLSMHPSLHTRPFLPVSPPHLPCSQPLP